MFICLIRTAVVLITVFVSASADAQSGYLDSPSQYVPNGISFAFPWMAFGDVNSDGRDDLVIARGSSITTYLSTQQGNFGTPSSISFSLPGITEFVGPLLADFDQDGNQDLVVVNQGTGYQVFRGDGVGAWSLWPGALGAIPSPYLAAPTLVDLDQDGMPELIFSSIGPNVPPGIAHHVISMANGTFSYAGGISSGIGDLLSFADVNGDGIQDIVGLAAPPNGPLLGGVLVSLGNGTFLGFAPPVFIPFPFPASDDVVMRTLDANGDGRDDLVLHRWDQGMPSAATPPPSEVWITLDLVTTLTWASFPAPGIRGLIRVGDINQDGCPDLIGAEGYPASVWPNMTPRSQVGVLLGDQAGGFLRPQLLVSPGGVLHWTLRLADMDGDGDPDPLLFEWGSGNMGILRNRARFGAACNGASMQGLQIGAGNPTIGSSGFTIQVTGAPPLSGAVLGLSLARSQAPGPCQVLIDLSSGNLILPLAITSTDFAGSASVAIPIPPNPALSGTSAFAQWAVIDPTAPQGFAFTRGAEMIVW